MNKAVAIATLSAKPIERFVSMIGNAEADQKDIGDFFEDVLKDVEMADILNIFLGFSKKMLKGMASLYNFKWTSYVEKFIDYANLMNLTQGVFN